MKARPILFSTEMVRAIQEGRKTQTRRIVKDIEKWPSDDLTFKDNILPKFHFQHTENEFQLIAHCPYGKPGDILWVRETFCKFPDGNVLYKANGCKPVEPYKWKPSIHMPKDAARIWLKITNLRVERLQDISNNDAIAEGIATDGKGHYKCYERNVGLQEFELETPFWSFSSLWTSINGGDSWEANPWVWVVEFKRIEKPDNA